MLNEESEDSEVDLVALHGGGNHKQPILETTQQEDDDWLLKETFSTILSKPTRVATPTKLPHGSTTPLKRKRTLQTPPSTTSSSRGMVGIEERKIESMNKFLPSDFIIFHARGKLCPMVHINDISLLPQSCHVEIEENADLYYSKAIEQELVSNLYLEITPARREMDNLFVVLPQECTQFAWEEEWPKRVRKSMLLPTNQASVLRDSILAAKEMFAVAVQREQELHEDEQVLRNLKHVITFDDEEEQALDAFKQEEEEIQPVNFRVGKKLRVQTYLGKFEKRRVVQVVKREDSKSKRKMLVQLDNGWWLGKGDYIKSKRNKLAYRFKDLVKAGSTFELGSCAAELQPEQDAIEAHRQKLVEQAEHEFPEFASLVPLKKKKHKRS